MSKSPEESSWVSGKTKEVQQTTLSSYFSQQHNRKRRKVTTNAPVVTPVKEQLYLDFGQADFGERRTCPHCGMMTVQGLEEDVQAHALVCDDYRRGILWRSTQHVVWKNEDGARIVKIRPHDAEKYQAKLENLQTIIDADLSFASNRNPILTCYLYIQQHRVLGFLATEDIQQALLKDKPVPCSLGIYKLWIHAVHRRRGIARRLYQAVCQHGVFGKYTSELALCSPTTAGLAWMTQCQENVLVYTKET